MTPVDLGSASSRVTVMEERRDPGRAEDQGSGSDRGGGAARGGARQAELRQRPRVFREPWAHLCAGGRLGGREVRDPRRRRLVQAAARAGRWARAWDRRRRIRTPRARSKPRSIPPPAGSPFRRSGSRTTSAGPSTRCLRAGRSRAACTWGFRGAHGRAGLPPPAAEALGALVHKIPSLLEYKSLHVARYARGRHRAGRGSDRTARSAPRKSGRGPASRAGGRPTRSTTRSACALMSAHYPGQGFEGIGKERIRENQSGPAHFRRCRIPSRSSPPPWKAATEMHCRELRGRGSGGRA